MFDEDNEFSSSRKDTLLNNLIVTYALTDYLSYHSATHSRQHPSWVWQKIFRISDDPIQTSFIISHPHWHPPQTSNLQKKSSAQNIVILPRTKRKLIAETDLCTIIPHRTPAYWKFINNNSETLYKLLTVLFSKNTSVILEKVFFTSVLSITILWFSGYLAFWFSFFPIPWLLGSLVFWFWFCIAKLLWVEFHILWLYPPWLCWWLLSPLTSSQQPLFIEMSRMETTYSIRVVVTVIVAVFIDTAATNDWTASRFSCHSLLITVPQLSWINFTAMWSNCHWSNCFTSSASSQSLLWIKHKLDAENSDKLIYTIEFWTLFTKHFNSK